MAPSRAPSSQASAASRSVPDAPARIVPCLSATCASARHAFASVRVGKVLKRRLPSRALQTFAWYVGLHVHRLPLRVGQSLPWRTRIPGLTSATLTRASDGGATVAPQSDPDFSPYQQSKPDSAAAGKKARKPVNHAGFRGAREAGAAGLEPATPGFGDRCSAS